VSTDFEDSLNTVSRPLVRSVGPWAVLGWVRLGWRDFRRAGWPSLLHGFLVTLMALMIVEIALLFWPLLPGAVSGFLLVGPILATGLFEISRRLEDGKSVSVNDALQGWRQGSRCLLRLGLLLVLIASLWVGISKLLFHFFVDADIERPTDLLRHVALQDEYIFFGWTLLAGLVVALVFALVVVAVPMLVDRDVSGKVAMKTSLRVVSESPMALLGFAVFILLATTLSVATLMLGFILLYPVMGHASWHLYRDLVDTEGLAPREGAG
jgi:uncharacterized membrane protein